MSHDSPSPVFPASSRRVGREIITLAGGCFWCLEAVYARTRGVTGVESGYGNGHVLAPSYEQVCQGNTGHAEVVRLEYDPAQVPLRELLEIFFVIHDPTTLNRQGGDVGPQYRSGIYHEHGMLAHKALAEEMIRALERQRRFDRPVLTEVLPLVNYWPAEAEHQHYFARHPERGYCACVVAPKLDKFRQAFPACWRG